MMARDNHQFAKFNKIGLDQRGDPRPDDLHLAWIAGTRVALLAPRCRSTGLEPECFVAPPSGPTGDAWRTQVAYWSALPVVGGRWRSGRAAAA